MGCPGMVLEQGAYTFLFVKKGGKLAFENRCKTFENQAPEPCKFPLPKRAPEVCIESICCL